MLVALLSALLSAGSGQCQALATFDCSSRGRGAIAEPEFLLTARRGRSCRFATSASRPGSFFVRLLPGASAGVSIACGNSSFVFEHGRVAEHRREMMTDFGRLRVVVQGGRGGGGGGDDVALEVRRSGDCPPGWQRLGAGCFGHVGRPLGFADSQLACASMRANLLHLPAGARLRPLLPRLWPNLTESSRWIGLTDAGQGGRSRYCWLSGLPYYTESDIGCSDGVAAKSCSELQRCVALSPLAAGDSDSDSNAGTVAELQSCRQRLVGLCFAPVGGVGQAYPVPQLLPAAGASGRAPLRHLWTFVVVAVLLLCCCCASCDWPLGCRGLPAVHASQTRSPPPAVLPAAAAAAAAAAEVNFEQQRRQLFQRTPPPTYEEAMRS